MKKIYLSFLSAGLLATGTFGQNLSSPYQFGEKNEVSVAAERTSNPQNQTPKLLNKALIWSEDFSGISTGGASTAGPTFTTNVGTWTTGGVDGGIWKHSFYTTSGRWSTNTPDFASTSASNGFMLFDADSVNTDYSANPIAMVANPVGFTGELISPSIDLTAQPSALLQFEQNFRWCCSATHLINVSVSSDGGGTWSTPYDVIPTAVAANDDHENIMGTYLMSVNISNTAAGNNVLLKFTWDGSGTTNSHYFWNIDDVSISTLPPDDVINEASYIVGDGNEGQEYGRTPLSQLPASWTVGSQVKNFGANAQPTVSLVADFGSFSSNPATVSIDPDSTKVIENVETPTLPIGMYDGTYTVSAATDIVGAPTFVDNVKTRQFEVTTNSYSLDGIGVYTNPVTSSITTASFTDAADNLIVGAMYHIKTPFLVDTVQVMLSSNTVEGGQMIAYITDTASFYAATIGTPLGFSAGYQVSAADVANGYASIPLASPVTLSPNAYYVAIELSSNGNTFDVGILDDQTVAQPGAASMIIIPANATDPATLFSNGEAIGIRLNTAAAVVGLSENSLEGVSIYPNPSNGMFTITNNEHTSNTVTIYNMVGKEVYSNVSSSNLNVNISENGSGVYIVKVSNETGSAVKRVVIK